ncbi:MAG: cyclic nucleotide-binding/CBS domain-containing protein [Halorientalis sp.]
MTETPVTETPVGEIMTTPVLTVAPDETLSDAAWAMRDTEIKSVAVIDADCDPVGILTSTDFVQLAADDVAPSETTVEEYMTTTVETVSPDTTVADAATHLLDGGFNHVPVVDGDVVGILTTTDILRHTTGSTTA